MKRPKKDKRVNRPLFSFISFFLYYIFAAFIVTCNLLMFIKVNKLELNIYNSGLGAITTLGNVIFFGLVIGMIDNLRKKITVERPVRRILEATRKVKDGDFSVRIEPIHKKSKSELDVMIDDFNIMVSELAGTETLRTDFLANVSHELKTPLSVIQNYATMLQSPELSPEQRTEYAKTISRASRRLSDLITNILRLNKLENQQIYPNVTDFNLGEQLCECLLNFEGAWEEKNIFIENDIEEDIIIRADRELLELVWNNLISNAVKFTPENGTIKVWAKRLGKKISVRVEDNGCGMTPEVQKHIFEKFYQGDTSHAMSGNGLGLALVKRIVDIMRAKLTVESVSGEGTSFTIVFDT